MKKSMAAGVIISVILISTYFIKINIEQGSNYITKSSLLGILIFYNPFVMAIYVLIIILLIAKGIKK